MAEEFYPGATKDILGDAGAYTGGPAKGVLHTTESLKYAAARSAYISNKSNPHFTVSYENDYFQCWQHCSIKRASRALKNLSGGAETNRDWAIQIEIVGTSDPNKNWGSSYVQNFPLGYLDGIRNLMRWVEQNAGVARYVGVNFKPYPSSYGNNGVRMSGATWDNYSGWCGHQHVPENSHGDPGAINIAYLMADPAQTEGVNDVAVGSDPKDLVRDVVYNSATGKGYVLDGWGGIHPLNGARPVTGNGYWQGWDIARKLIITNWDAPAGFTVDGYGGVHVFGGAVSPSGAPYFNK